MERSRSPFLPVVAVAIAFAASLARWLLQGAWNLYTDADKRLYVPDPDLGWRAAKKGVAWVGLEAVGVVAGVGVAIVVAGWVIRRRERKLARPWRLARLASWGLALATLALPIWAFALGRVPAGARLQLPLAGAVIPAGKIEAKLDAAAGLWVSVPHEGTRLVATIKAGGERFDARFPLEGTWRGDPGDLAQPMSADFIADATKVDTGIDLRSTHAREYLKTHEHRTLRFRMTRLVGAVQEAPDRVAWTAEGTVEIMGATVPATASGTLRTADEAARARLGVKAPAALVLAASFTLDIRQTPLAAEAGDFEESDIVVAANAVLVRHSQGDEI